MSTDVTSKTAAAIAAARDAGRTALVAYLPAGYPSVADCVEAAVALGENGADVIEIGLPYTDPVMDGPVIQRATAASLAAGFRVADVFEIVRQVTARTDAAVLVMTYWNLVDRMGVEEFAGRLAAAGGAGLITPDLVPEEAGEWFEASDRHGLDRVFLTAPSSSPERVRLTVEASRGFVYAVSVMGVTGARDQVSDAAEAVVRAAREAGAEHVCVGLGVSQAEHVREIGAFADGAIVGTALVRALTDGGPEAVAALTRELAAGTVREA
ncbi:tryptophan synthase subunit alpha [Micrococcus sp. 2A]|uniref:tryptophan synthase subunit alpha n=1 Tax=Micrococcus TaxID=1269 RepID=UPI0020054C31|nr:tryptophan synthase subunit alpha [Micrococcus sp. M4NT]MCK6095654.1 tryptophan synthase subunit alpha [Micrococcus sp. EYE_212]MCK6171729.1 tryptophan synthase subunit alpha [Micrococcus sp. EYE_162]MDX2340919.1 tryptophan synthase subunit alpha [Micrococcus sp. M4NT]